MTYLLVRYVHIIGATILFGTGLGIAFFLFIAIRSRDVAVIAATLRAVVVADFVFTAPAVLIQLASGATLSAMLGLPFTEPWIAGSLALYVLVGVCWLPVVAIQARMGRLAAAAAQADAPLPAEYHRLFRLWFALGWPAFLSVIAIFAVMIWKPQLW